ncbi:NPL4-like protein 2 [Magnolia sinica]|uniref:NPL4-like protein 2 n=1 Tax=Magnolia sinica TaxID=86752 RepID=UPI00265B31B6|nr:NPL4-like protein 2 [Magnolia sinica]
MAMIRIRSRDGLERVRLPNPPSSTTISDLKSLIESQLHVPVTCQTLSLNQNLLIAKIPSDLQTLSLDSSVGPTTPLSSLNLSNGSIVYLSYPPDIDRSVPAPAAFSPANSFGRNKMTIDDLIARQMRVTRQESPHCDSVSFDRDAAHAFQHYVNDSLAFAVKRAGFMYGRIADGGRVEVDFIYEPPQQGTEEQALLLRDPDEEALVEAVALGLGMRRVGFIFSQAVGQDKGDYTMSGAEVLQAAEMHAQSGVQEWVTAVVKLEVNEDGGADVHFEAFQMSDMCVRLFKEGWFETEVGEEGLDPKLSRMKKDVVVGGKDTREVDNDFFLVVVKILDHQGPLSSTFPIENRMTSVSMRALKNHLDRTKHLPFVKRISDFHLLLLLARFLDVNADVPALAECVQTQSPVPEGYQLLIESLASAS